MSASIGGYGFIRLRGRLRGMAERLAEITRPNVDGQAYRKSGKRAPVSSMESLVDIDTAENADALALNYEALKGTLVTVVDDLGIETQNVAVLDVDVSAARAVTGAGGGLCESGSNYLVRATWSLQVTEEAS